MLSSLSSFQTFIFVALGISLLLSIISKAISIGTKLILTGVVLFIAYKVYCGG